MLRISFRVARGWRFVHLSINGQGGSVSILVSRTNGALEVLCTSATTTATIRGVEGSISLTIPFSATTSDVVVFGSPSVRVSSSAILANVFATASEYAAGESFPATGPIARCVDAVPDLIFGNQFNVTRAGAFQEAHDLLC